MKKLIIFTVCSTLLLLQGCETTTLDNKQLVTSFYKEVLINRNVVNIDHYIGDTYIQHNPYVADGKNALVGFIKTLPKVNNKSIKGEIVRIIAEDDLVVLHVRNPSRNAIVDIFRVKNNKIVEHWDVIQAIPKKSANNNTMF